MRRLAFILILTILFCPLSSALDNPWETRLPLKSGMIVYKCAGSMNGKKALYFKDYGRTRAEYQKVSLKMMGMTSTESTTKITTPDWIYTIDNLTKQGTREANPNKFLSMEFAKLNDTEKAQVISNINKTGKFSIEGFQGKINLKAAKVLGYDCDIVTVLDTKLYMISGTDISLKTVGNTMGVKIEETATSIKEGTPPAKAFKIPGINFETDQQSDNLLQDQAKSVIQSLLHGTAIPADASGADSAEEMFLDRGDLPFDEDMTDEQAIRFRQQQDYNSIDEDEEDYSTQEEDAQAIQQGLKKMFKSMF